MKRRIRHIRGIRCEFEIDQNGFTNVYISDGQSLPVEWIVRGGVDEKTAIVWADRAIELLKTGHILLHDSEGVIRYVKDPYQEGEEWKEIERGK
jgi:hypothetical protein